MQSPLHHHVRPGIVHFMAFPATSKGEGPIVDTLRTLLADPYFEILEITWVNDPAVRAQVKQLLAGSGVEVKYGAYPRQLGQQLDLNSADDAERAKAVAGLRLAISEAAEIGARDVGFLSGKDVAASERGRAMDRLEHSLVDLCRFAAGLGVRLVLEVFDRDIDKKALIGPAATAREIAQRVTRSCPNFGLLVDLSHIPLLGESPEQALLPVKEHLVHAHIGNAYFGSDRASPVWGDHHPYFGYPGGVNDVPQIVAFLRTLAQVGYINLDGPRAGISFEMKPVPGQDPLAMIAGAKRKLNEAWAQLNLTAS
jgi:sugar phosphate isomerase/epimerase